MDIQNIIMQGTLFGSIICTAVVDKLAKIFYSDKNLLYLYKDKLEVPILGMVDDVINVNKCLNKTVVSNSIINSFIETDELTLAHTKCSKMHIGKNAINVQL